jgi:hypothetical protein
MLPPLSIPPPDLWNLMTGSNKKSRDFRSNIRAYNSILAFTSMGANIDRSLERNGIYSFRIHGALYHRMGSLIPTASEQPRFAQLYIYDDDAQLDHRMSIMDSLHRETLSSLQNMLRDNNPFVESFKSAVDQINELGDAENWSMIIKESSGNDRRRYNRPAASEIAAIFPGEPVEASYRDIVLRQNDGGLRRINELNGAYDPLHYVLLHPTGDFGFQLGIPFAEGAMTKRTGISPADFYSFRLMHREGEMNLILNSGRLLQQYLVDQYAKIESQRLWYIRCHQDEIRADMYQNVFDALNADDENMSKSGKRLVLPSSFSGSPRQMQQLYQDSMAIIRQLGKPDFFITFTCNPNWKEIVDELELGHLSPQDRPDLIARVFRLKLKNLMNFLVNDKFLGTVLGHIHVIEFQKRGLPHAHILLIVADEDKPRTVDDIDKVVCAEIPDGSDPELLTTILNCNIHGPCGPAYPKSPCMVNGKCSKKYPKSHNEETQLAADGYPEYRRRHLDAPPVSVRGATTDNRWVVPYNPTLSKKFNAHINVEVCNSISSVKYLYKYVYKGHDKAMVELKPGGQHVVIDEIAQYLDCRYVSASESAWRIFGFDLHHQYPPVLRLAVHLENQQPVYFKPSDTPQSVIQRQKLTTLEAWFELNRTDPDARTLKYFDLPTKYVWKQDLRRWKTRQRQTGNVGRMYFVHPGAGERYFLRLLLNHVAGCQSYQDVRTVDGVVHGSFKEACVARGLLEDDSEWETCMVEALGYQMPSQLRELFVVLMVYCNPQNSAALWERFKYDLSEDIHHRLSTTSIKGDIVDLVEEAHNMALKLINEKLQQQGKTTSDFGLPVPRQNVLNRLILEQLEYSREECLEKALHSEQLMNDGQRAAYNRIVDAVEGRTSDHLFFIDGPGGTGKTFLENAILAYVRGQGKIALAHAASGIAAILLDGGKTAHSGLKIPLIVDGSSTCNISLKSDLAELIRRAAVILWDEVPMVHRHAVEAVERTLADIMAAEDPANKNKLFGGKIIVFAGDFRQILPVVKKGNRPQIVSAAICRSRIWNSIIQLRLTENMRIQTAENVSADELKNYSQWLLDIGEGKFEQVQFPDAMVVQGDEEVLVDKVYSSNVTNTDYAGAAILAPKNTQVDAINNIVLKKLPGQEKVFYSSDSICEEGGNNHMYPVEFLNKITPSGIPHHELKLKQNSVVMMMRNLDFSGGLCNGTRLVIRDWTTRLLKADIVVGEHAGKTVFIPRIGLIPSDTELPFEMKRVQFPVKLAFAMTINKSQGQSLDKVGVYLKDDVFSHGQLYVALSRAKDPSKLWVMLNDDAEGTSPNVVYKEIFNK